MLASDCRLSEVTPALTLVGASRVAFVLRRFTIRIAFVNSVRMQHYVSNRFLQERYLLHTARSSYTSESDVPNPRTPPDIGSWDRIRFLAVESLLESPLTWDSYQSYQTAVMPAIKEHVKLTENLSEDTSWDMPLLVELES